MRIAWTLAVLMCSLGVLGGCNEPHGATKAASSPSAGQTRREPSPRPQKAPGEWTANEVLQQLLTTYRDAKTYEDQAVVRLSYRQGSQPVNLEWPAAVAYERPGKLSIEAYQATVKCDGKELKARIEDEPSNNVDQQVVVRPAPAEIKLSDLASDALLYDILSSRLRRQPIQLELLLESGGLVSAFGADIACKRLADGQHGGQSCFRIEVPSPGGAFVFWVDQGDLLLRRLDYPAATLAPDLAGEASVSDLALWADLREAKIGKAIPAGRFGMSVPAGAKRMRSFVIPPRPLPSELFGQEPQEFFFTTLDGGALRQKELAGKITILAWYHDNPACEATLQQVALARQRLSGDRSISFYAVATDPTTRDAEALLQRLAGWKVELPIVRDLEAFGDKSFHIAVQPTVVVLDQRGCVQIFQAGGSPELADQILAIVQRLKRGDDLAAEIVNQHAREQREYEQLLARGGREPGEIVELPEAVIRRRSEPKKLHLAPLWTVTEISRAGNIALVSAADSSARVFVVEAWRSVAEFDADGKRVGHHALAIPQQAAVTFMRTATNRAGKRFFACAAPLAPQFFLFDEDWRLLLAYPPEDQAPLRIVDLALAELDEKDDTPVVLVASAGDVGVVAVSSTGQVRWRNHRFPNALSVAMMPEDDVGSWAVLVAGDSGQALRINRFGNEEPPAGVAKWPIGRLFAGRFGKPGQADLLALSENAEGQPTAVGLSSQLTEIWNYPLPAGIHQRPIEPVASSQMLPGHTGEWWLAGPDGSVHLITADGRLFDSFHVGAALTGIAAGNVAGQPALFISTEQGVAAWKVRVER